VCIIFVCLDMYTHTQTNTHTHTQLAPMSTTDSWSVAKSFAASRRGLIFEYVTQGNSRGVEISDFSMYPKEREFLYPVRKVRGGRE
jgi:hypothetical protein